MPDAPSAPRAPYLHIPNADSPVELTARYFRRSHEPGSYQGVLESVKGKWERIFVSLSTQQGVQLQAFKHTTEKP